MPPIGGLESLPSHGTHTTAYNVARWNSGFCRRWVWRWQPSGIQRRAIALMMEAVHISETSVYLNENIRRYVTEGCNFHSQWTFLYHRAIRPVTMMSPSYQAWCNDVCKMYCTYSTYVCICFCMQVYKCKLRPHSAYLLYFSFMHLIRIFLLIITNNITTPDTNVIWLTFHDKQ
jgi:hypothetical protein